MQLAPRLALISTLLVAGCSDGGYEIELQFESPAARDATRAITLALIAGGCGGLTRGAPADAPLQERLLRRAGERPSFEPASADRYGVYAIARDETCTVRAAGCREIDLTPGGSGTIVVQLEDLSAAACASCDDGECTSELDAGVRDASVDAQARDAQSDAAPIDASPDDAGVDAGRDGGTDAGLDGGTDAGPPSSLCPGLDSPIFCNDFELPPSASSEPWDEPPYHQGSGDVGFVTGSAAAFGARAGRAYVGDDDSKARFEVEIPTISSGHLWVRGYFHVSSTDLRGLAVIYVVDAGEGIALQLRNDGTVGTYIGTHSSSTTPQGSRDVMPLGTWACVVMHIEMGSSGVVEIFVDGDPTPERFSGYDTRPTGGFQRLIVGIEKVQDGSAAPATVLVDEVALSTMRLGC